jgi:hypothetical protein
MPCVFLTNSALDSAVLGDLPFRGQQSDCFQDFGFEHELVLGIFSDQPSDIDRKGVRFYFANTFLSTAMHFRFCSTVPMVMRTHSAKS